MTRQDYESKSFLDLMEQLYAESDDITTREDLQEYAIRSIRDDSLYLAIHILEALREEYGAEWFLYDYSMGTLQTPSGVTCKEDVEHLIDDEERGV